MASARVVALFVIVASALALSHAAPMVALKSFYTSSDCSTKSFDKSQPVQYIGTRVCEKVPSSNGEDVSSMMQVSSGVVRECVYTSRDCSGTPKCMDVGMVGTCEAVPSGGFSKVSPVSTKKQSVVVREYLDAFCGTVQTTENFNTNECTAELDIFTKYMVGSDGMVHCDFSNSACEGTPIKCVVDQLENNKCTQPGTGVSSRIEWEESPVAHSLSFDEQGFEVLASSSSGSQPVVVTTITVYHYRNSSSCWYPQTGGQKTLYYYYTNGKCQTSDSTPSRSYREKITVNGDATAYGQWCRYSDNNCYNLIGCTTISSGTCTTQTVSSRRGESIEFYYGATIDLSGLAAAIIVIIVIAALVVCGGVITACCCAGAAAALLGRICCGLCGQKTQYQTQTAYHVRLTS